MNPEQIKEGIQAVVDGLTPLASKLGIAIGEVFGWAVRQNYSFAAIDLIVAIFILFGGRYLGKLLIGKKKSSKTEEEIIMVIIGWIISTISAIIAFMLICFATYRIINPEWSAISDIMSIVSSYKK